MKVLLLLVSAVTFGSTALASHVHFSEYTYQSSGGGTKMANPTSVCEHFQIPSSYAYETIVAGKKFKGAISVSNRTMVNCDVDNDGNVELEGLFSDVSTDGDEGCSGTVKIRSGGGARFVANFTVRNSNNGLYCAQIGVKSRVTLDMIWD